MINVADVFSFVSFIINKNLNGAFTPKGFNNAIVAANLSLFDELRGGRFSSYQPGRPVPVIGMEENQTLSEELDPFIKTGVITITDGIGVIPDDLVQTLGVIVNGTNVPVSWVKKGDLGDYLISDIDFPQADVNPIYTNIGGSWEVYPITIPSVKVYYLRFPTTPKYDYTVDPTAGITYNSETSVNFEWKKTAFMALCSKTLSFLGVNLSNDQLLSYAERMKTEEK